MASYQNIEEYRRKKRLKRLARNLLLSAAILAALFGVLYLCDVFEGSPVEEWLTGTRTVKEDKFPLTVKKEQLISVYGVGSNLAVLTKSSLLFYDFAGEHLGTQYHGYTNPVTRESGKRLLTYDRGGLRLRVDSASGKIGELTMESAIISAQMSPSGKVAVLMSYRANVPVLVVYDENLELVYRYFSAEDFTALAFSSDGTHVLLSSIQSKGGILSTELYELDSTQTGDSGKTVTLVNDILPVAISYLSDGSWMVAGKDSAVCIDARTKAQTRYEYEGTLQRLALCGEEALVLVNEDLFSSYSTITLLTKGGMPQKTTRIEDEVLDVCCRDGQVYVLGKQSAYRYDFGLKLQDELPLEKSCKKIGSNAEAAFIMGEDTVQKFPPA